MGTPQSRPLGFGDLDLTGSNQAPSHVLAQSVQGFPDAAIPKAEEWNTLGRQWCTWHRHLDSRTLRSERLCAGATARLSSTQFSYVAAAGLQHAVAADSCYLVDGYVVDLPKTRLAANTLLDPYTFTASKWHHFYMHPDGEIAVDVVNPGVAAAPPAGTRHLGTGRTDATDLVAWEDGDVDFASVGLPLSVELKLSKLTISSAADETPLSVTGVSPTLPAVRAANAAGGGAYEADVGASTGQGYRVALGNSAATGFLATLANSPAGARGLKITADGTSAGVGLDVEHAGSGSAGRFTSTGSGAALQVIGSASASGALDLTGGALLALIKSIASGGAGAAYLESDGGATLLATSTNVNGKTLELGTVAGASNSARCIRATASGSAVAIEPIATGNYPLLLRGDTTNPLYGELGFTGQNARPLSNFDGGLQWNTTERQFVQTDAFDGGRGLWATIGGKVTARTTGAATTIGGAVWVTVCTLTATGSNAPKRSGSATLRFRGDARMMVANPGTLNVRIIDKTADPGEAAPLVTWSGSGTGDTAGYYLGHATTQWQRPITLDRLISIPAGGDRQWLVQIQTATADNIRVRGAAWIDGMD